MLRWLLLFPMILYVRDVLAQKLSSDTTSPDYPLKQYRYSLYLWNRYAQYCYTDEELVLLDKIKTEYKLLNDDKHREDFFELTEEKKWHDYWICKKPYLKSVQQEFTLPNREAKDTKIHPLWNYADDKAREIANWQGERTKGQSTDLMNDPVMLVFEELKHWFFDVLSEKECRKEVRDYIAKRQGYINSLVYAVPDFGLDRVHLREIQQSLEGASKTISSCVVNKELPQLLSDLINKGKSLENAVGTYLHFLPINEEVSENYSPEYAQDSLKDCKKSPICKVYKAVNRVSGQSEMISSYQPVNRFYELVKVTEDENNVHIDMQIKKNLLDQINFASFVTETDKANYLEIMATLESLIKVRKVFEQSQFILPKIGTYMFAASYLQNVDALAINYVKYIEKIETLVNQLIKSAEKGLNNILINPSQQNKFFEKNMRALETKVVTKTTVSSQLNSYVHSAIESMNKYQQEMKKLATDMTTGEAKEEVNQAAQDLYNQMSQLNAVLPVLLMGEKTVVIARDNNQIEQHGRQLLSISDQDAPFEKGGRQAFFARRGDFSALENPPDAQRACVVPLFHRGCEQINNIKVFSYGIGKNEEQKELVLSPKDNTGMNSLPEFLNKGERVQCQFTQLTSLLSDSILRQARVCKLDVEGQELSILGSLQDHMHLLKQCVFIVEISPHFLAKVNQTADEIYHFFNRAGFRSFYGYQKNLNQWDEFFYHPEYSAALNYSEAL